MLDYPSSPLCVPLRAVSEKDSLAQRLAGQGVCSPGDNSGLSALLDLIEAELRCVVQAHRFDLPTL